ncbi:MAG: DAK2 domain-containing protein, partial [Oscillospiraceae bacterium]|nr:DAK2 domain-containing protein [Oscillospiraceae bacterium]
ILTAMAQKVCEDGKEFISVFYGSDIDEETAKKTALPIFGEYCPDAEVALIYGGQPVYYYLISAE